ncbi:Oidioi.mRNA.OKI2018_I69.chr2.g6243.t1.cds [Oikopleura dioica]|uniref:Oidioi.mRNA.OKI2018_I69.chr2.g6243.t1.cds n=1 Tax=Oikopleura dioica TaxID=34765 RepID=A0ABN7T2F4_OIKDI|nr:Oidioi.mRNA.OKI2018_I69.chr2.g6243.t1.cds [Oikopleura dioica]
MLINSIVTISIAGFGGWENNYFTEKIDAGKTLIVDLPRGLMQVHIHVLGKHNEAIAAILDDPKPENIDKQWHKNVIYISDDNSEFIIYGGPHGKDVNKWKAIQITSDSFENCASYPYNPKIVRQTLSESGNRAPPVLSDFEQMMTPALAQWASQIQSQSAPICDLPELLPVSENDLDGLLTDRSREESQDSLGYNSATSSVLDPGERHRESSLNSVFSDASCSSNNSVISDTLTKADETINKETRQRKPFQRVIYTDEQLSILALRFEEKRYLTTEERHQLATEIGITDTQVKVWFQNRRAKEKRKRYSKDSGLSFQ